MPLHEEARRLDRLGEREGAGDRHLEQSASREVHELAADGVTERPLRANRIRVHGGPQTFTNPGPAFALSLHAA